MKLRLDDQRMNLYDKYGIQVIRAIISDFIDRVFIDPSLHHTFRLCQVQKVKRFTISLFACILGSREHWMEDGLRNHSARITSDDYEKMISYLDDSMKKFNIGVEERAIILGTTRSVKYFVIQRQVTKM
ncbi:hypothetical protein SAMN04487866_1057 [Thermoactinomyces sp. DSM 45891]|uniref:hypothetical protein n=1 Tax=Thermoactinomyces sp. DSM 45891 TaxID=1761907 RepID=UPI0009157D78|nr:hypothetical protein [Thermoactinomyces sp. DSM 45891]SFX33244.1 hypothetical protein SAMN04487866_1057 [Thermoactinomyces sp. DSM 45891]